MISNSWKYYHVNPATGKVSMCMAGPKNCAFGMENHYAFDMEAEEAAQQLLARKAAEEKQPTMKKDEAPKHQSVPVYHDILTDEQRAHLDNALKWEPRRFATYDATIKFHDNDGFQCPELTIRNWRLVEFKGTNPREHVSPVERIYMQNVIEDYPDDGTNYADYLNYFGDRFMGDYFPDEPYEHPRMMVLEREHFSHNEATGEEWKVNASAWNNTMSRLDECARRLEADNSDDTIICDLCGIIHKTTDNLRIVSVYDRDSLPNERTDLIYAGEVGTTSRESFDDEEEWCEWKRNFMASAKNDSKMTSYVIDHDCWCALSTDPDEDNDDDWCESRCYWRYEGADSQNWNYQTEYDFIEKAADKYGVYIPPEWDSDDGDCWRARTFDTWNATMRLLIERAEAERYMSLVNGNTTDYADDVIAHAKQLMVSEAYMVADDCAIDDIYAEWHVWDKLKNMWKHE